MFGIFSGKDRVGDSYFPITTDMHCHLLPGIDDGSPDVATSIMLVKGMQELGITGAICTPHIIGDLYRNDSSSIMQAYNVLDTELKRQNIAFRLSAAAEYMLDSHFIELLNRKERLLAIKDNYILTEFSYMSRHDHIEEISFMIQTEGYIPILAHPERYPYYHSTPGMYSHLKDLGFKLQLNLLSLTGYYGKETRKAARYIVQNELASFAGTDLHHDRHLAALSDKKNRRTFHDLLGNFSWNDELN